MDTKELVVELDDATARGTYCNLGIISFIESEFVIDSIFLQPGSTKAKIVSRVITSPLHAKRTLLALQDNIAAYEAKYGEIKVTPLQKPGLPS